MAATQLPKEMKTLLQPDIHSTKIIKTTAPLPIPTHPEDVLVRVYACSPCAGELQWAANFPDLIPKDRIPVPTQDMAGEVVTAPEGSGFAPGDRVFCRIDASRAGAAREYALPRVSELAKIPPSLDWVQAAAVPLSALTAWQAVFEQGTLEAAAIHGDVAARERNANKRVLITAASGGVGSWALQLAALAGAGGIVAVAGRGKEALVRERGATEVVDYTRTSLEEWVAENPAAREVDLVVDGVGGKTLVGCWAAVKEGGAMVGINTPPSMVKPADLNKSVTKEIFFVVAPLGSQLAEIGELVEAGKVKPVIDSVYDFDEFEKAFARLEEGHGTGKILIKVHDQA
ncbi:NAD(P)-binding protein [Thozetella sp. PMI_491]|nr:NAD(P)-binding protein [Thozetella sp. PMI_491]